MILLVLLSCLPILLRMETGNIYGDEYQKRKRLIGVAIVLILVMGLRSRYLGSYDTDTYCKVFENAHRLGSIRSYLKYIGITERNFLFSEVGFYAYVWILSRVTSSTVIFLLITSSIIIIPICTFINDNSDDRMLSIFMFITQGSFIFCMNGMRQALAMSICLLAYKYAKRQNILKFIAILLIAMLFHKTAFIFGIVYFIPKLKYNWKAISLMFLSVIGLLTFADRAISIFDSLTDKTYSYSATIESGGAIAMAVYIIIILVAIMFKGWEDNQETTTAFWLTVFAAVLYGCRFIIAGPFERLSYYFAYFSYIMFPNVLVRIENYNNRKVLSVLFVVLAILLFGYRTAHGSFSVYQLFFQ